MLLRVDDFRAAGGDAASPAPRIAVIDSGVHAAHPHVQGVAGGIGIDDQGRRHADYLDRLGHGTAVTAVIREKAPAAQVWAVKVFDRELAATGAALVAGLQWAREHRLLIANLSLGTLNPHHADALAAEVAAARDGGLLIVAAAPEEGRHWLPGALDDVIQVRLDMTLGRDECAVAIADEGRVTIRASGYPRPIPGVPPERNLKGVSFAVANATGILARTWGRWPAALRQRLERLSPPS